MREGDQNPPGPAGRDEMNLAEFPITSLADRAPPGSKTLVLPSTQGTLTITGSDEHGLPTALDADVIVGLIQLTKRHNDFTAPRVEFTRYEFLKLLGWPNEGRSYHRLKNSLRCWVGVTLHYDGCWFDIQRRRRVSESFHILDHVSLSEDGDERRSPSSCTWGHRFFESCRAGNLKQLDTAVYFGLRSAVSKRIYRFLDKRFHVRAEWTLDLEEFAFAHVGLSRNYAPRKVREKLKPALEELEAIGFLAPDPARYGAAGRGKWTIRLARGRAAQLAPAPMPLLLGPPAPAPDPPAPDPLAAELVARGVSAASAADLVRAFPEARIRAQIEALDWHLKKKSGKRIGDPAAYLVESIRRDYAPPAGMVAAARRAERSAAEEARADAARAERERARAEQTQVDAYWAGLSPAEQAQLEAEALEHAGDDAREQMARGAFVRGLRQALREEEIRRRLGLPGPS